MTEKWGEIKKKIESQGITDDSDISYIDLSFDIDTAEDIKAEEFAGSWEIH